jgi:hypothetical protein
MAVSAPITEPSNDLVGYFTDWVEAFRQLAAGVEPPLDVIEAISNASLRQPSFDRDVAGGL